MTLRESQRRDRLPYASPSGLGSGQAVGSAGGWVRFRPEEEGPFSTGLDTAMTFQGRGAGAICQ
jgi:hypothetical protein